MTGNVHRIAPYNPDAHQTADAVRHIKGVMGQIMVCRAALKSAELCDDMMRKTLADMLFVSFADLDNACEFLEGPSEAFLVSRGLTRG